MPDKDLFFRALGVCSYYLLWIEDNAFSAIMAMIEGMIKLRLIFATFAEIKLLLILQTAS